MDADASGQDAAACKIQVSGGDDLGAGGCENGAEGYGGQCENGDGKIFAILIKVCSFCSHCSEKI